MNQVGHGKQEKRGGPPQPAILPVRPIFTRQFILGHARRPVSFPSVVRALSRSLALTVVLWRLFSFSFRSFCLSFVNSVSVKFEFRSMLHGKSACCQLNSFEVI